MSWCYKFLELQKGIEKNERKIQLKVPPLGYNVNETKFAACCKCISAYTMLQLFICVLPILSYMYTLIRPSTSVLRNDLVLLKPQYWLLITTAHINGKCFCEILSIDSGLQSWMRGGQRKNTLDILLWWHKGCWALFGIQMQSKWTIPTMPHVSIWS